jgi:hypothetical protein
MPKPESCKLYRHWHNLDSSQLEETSPMAFRLLEMFKEISSGPKEELGKQKKCPSPFFEEG